MIVSLVLDVTTQQLEDKFPENQGAKYFKEQLKQWNGSWLNYLLTSEDSNDCGDGRKQDVSLYPHFNSARQDISNILDFVLRWCPNERPSSKDLLQQLGILKDKYCTVSDQPDGRHGENVCGDIDNTAIISEKKEQAEIELADATVPTTSTISSDIKNDVVAPTTSGTKRKRNTENNNGDEGEIDFKKQKK